MKLNILLLFISLTWCLDWFETAPTLIFMCSGLAIVPLAGLLGKATESIAVFTGPPLAVYSPPPWGSLLAAAHS